MQRKVTAFAILGDFVPRFLENPSSPGAATAGQGIDIPWTKEPTFLRRSAPL